MKTRDLHPREKRIRDKRGEPMKSVVHDPYASKYKLSGPSICPQCGVAYIAGRWLWQKEMPADSGHALCPACHRVNDEYPAGEVTLSGDFLTEHGQEILNLLHREADAENLEHPLNRIMAIREGRDQTVVTTTDVHLPRRFVHALQRAFKGQFDIHFDEEGHFARANWHRAH
jgi:hypothetical protein